MNNENLNSSRLLLLDHAHFFTKVAQNIAYNRASTNSIQVISTLEYVSSPSVRYLHIEGGKTVRVTLFFSQIIPKRSEWADNSSGRVMSYRRLILYFSLYFRNELNAVPFETRIEIPHTFVRSFVPGRKKRRERTWNKSKKLYRVGDFQ